MAYLKKWPKRLLTFSALFIVFKMAFDVWWIPNYINGDAYVSYSPDGQYKMAHVYAPKSENNQVVSHILTSISSNDVLAIIPVPLSYIGNFQNLWWCGEAEDNCRAFTYYTGDDSLDINLDPSLWRRVHAWLTVKIKGLEEPNFTEFPTN